MVYYIIYVTPTRDLTMGIVVVSTLRSETLGSGGEAVRLVTGQGVSLQSVSSPGTPGGSGSE